jgi:predicted component of type VI protein secretion system
MSTTLLIHTQAPLDEAAREAVHARLQSELGTDARLEASRRPHLCFASYDAARRRSTQVLAAIRAQGVDARFVDL